MGVNTDALTVIQRRARVCVGSAGPLPRCKLSLLLEWPSARISSRSPKVAVQIFCHVILLAAHDLLEITQRVSLGFCLASCITGLSVKRAHSEQRDDVLNEDDEVKSSEMSLSPGGRYPLLLNLHF